MASDKPSFPFKRFSIIFFPFLTLFLIVFWILIESESQHEIDFKSVEEMHSVLLAREIIAHRMEEVRSDIVTQANHHELARYFRTERARELNAFTRELSRFVEIKGLYHHARLLDVNGREVLRINLVKGKAHIVEQKDLQDKSGRYYYKEAIKLDKGMIYVSRFDLNMEYGKIEAPYQPIIRFVTPVFDENGKKRGLLVLNYLGSKVLEDIESIFKDKLSMPLLINREGYFLKGLKAEDEWGFMLPGNQAKKFDAYFPRAWQQLRTRESGKYFAGNGLFTFATVSYSSEYMNWNKPFTYSSESEHLVQWKVISFLPKEKLNLTKTKVFIRHSTVPLFLIPVLFLLSWMLAAAIEKKRNEEQKQLENEKRLQTILDALPERIFWKDENLSYLGCNRSFARDAGFDNPRELRGKSDFQMPWSSDAESYHADDRDIMREGREKINFEATQKGSDGEMRWLEMSKLPLVNLKGDIYGILGTYRDISERKLKAARTTIYKDNLIDLLQTPFISLESNYAIITKIASISLEVERISIWLYDDEKTAIICQDLYLRGSDSHEKGIVLYAGDYPGYFKALERNRPIVAHDALTHRDTAEFSEPYLKPNGITSMLDVPIWHKGIIRGVICCEHVGEQRTWHDEETDFLMNVAFLVAQTMDANEKEVLQKKRAELIGELEYANKELSDFAYIVSHDLKAPLRGIASLANWLASDYADKFDEEGREHLQLLTGRVDRMNSLINGILMYSRAGRAKMVNDDVDLNMVLKEIVDSISPPDNIKIELKGPFPHINCDWIRMVQVFQNLISNALNYMDKDEGIIVVDCREENDACIFSVSDNGPGIEEKYFEKIFHIFQTLSPRDDMESTGVGLSLVRKIIELYNGRVWVESTPGEGSTFYFTLPLSMKSTKEGKS